MAYLNGQLRFHVPLMFSLCSEEHRLKLRMLASTLCHPYRYCCSVLMRILPLGRIFTYFGYSEVVEIVLKFKSSMQALNKCLVVWRECQGLPLFIFGALA